MVDQIKALVGVILPVLLLHFHCLGVQHLLFKVFHDNYVVLGVPLWQLVPIDHCSILIGLYWLATMEVQAQLHQSCSEDLFKALLDFVDMLLHA